jgi:hypothetical protein
MEPLLPPAHVGFPDMVFPTGIAAYPTIVFAGLYNTPNLLFWGPKFDADDESGILTEPPVVTDLAYNILEPAVDADGNDIDGGPLDHPADTAWANAGRAQRAMGQGHIGPTAWEESRVLLRCLQSWLPRSCV